MKLLALLSAVACVFLPGVLFAQQLVTDPVAGLRQTAETGALVAPGQQPTSVVTVAGNVIGSALSIVAVIFFILMVYGGFVWMTARGNDQLVEKGRNTIVMAITGMVVIFGAYAITTLVFNSTNSSAGPSGGGQACSASTPCAQGSQCVNGTCQALPAGQCTRDQDCDRGFVCRNNACVDIQQDFRDAGLDPDAQGAECNVPRDCPGDQDCILGRCV